MTTKHVDSKILVSALQRSGGIDLLAETVTTFSALARRLPHRRGDSPTHVSTIHRWRLRGLQGVRLEAIRCGGSWVTSLEAYQRFCDALTRQSQVRSVASAPSNAQHERTEQQLKDAFKM